MQLQQNIEQFDAADVAVFAISYDPLDSQQAFAEEFAISYPLLADPDHAAIEATGILNTLVEPEESVYGIPFPGSYVIGTDGTVEEKLFFQNYRNRASAATVLRDGLGLDFEVENHPHADVSGEGVSISATLGGEAMVFAEVSILYVDIDLDDGLHLYGQPIPEGFIPTEVSVEAPEGVEVAETRYPATVPFHIEGIDEEFHTFEAGRIRIAVPINNGLREGDTFPLTVNVSYQACTDRECYLPQNRTLELDVPLLPLNRRQPPS
ncbi:MAG: redoxin domain-containing protein [Dehalococcoidia bacterium]|nr:redoxin domain-containing protein [Dehalococcoidia bacterium]